jgi:hypothetical protein
VFKEQQEPKESLAIQEHRVFKELLELKVFKV